MTQLLALETSSAPAVAFLLWGICGLACGGAWSAWQQRNYLLLAVALVVAVLAGAGGVLWSSSALR